MPSAAAPYPPLGRLATALVKRHPDGPAAAARLARLWAPLPHRWPQQHSSAAAPDRCRPEAIAGWALPLSGLADWLADLPAADLQALATADGAPPVWPPPRRLAWLAGRLCAEAALAELGIRSTQVVRCRDGAPVWPAGSCGSITHSQDLAAAVVGRSRHWSALGLDSEALLTPAQAADVAQMCCDPAERHAVVPPGHGPCGLRCTVLFCAKEAWFKAVAGRLPRRLGFDEVRVTGLEDLPRLPSGDRLGGRHNDFQCGLSGRCHVAATAPDLAAFHDPLPAAWHIEQGALHLLLAMPAEAS